MYVDHKYKWSRINDKCDWSKMIDKNCTWSILTIHDWLKLIHCSTKRGARVSWGCWNYRSCCGGGRCWDCWSCWSCWGSRPALVVRMRDALCFCYYRSFISMFPYDFRLPKWPLSCPGRGKLFLARKSVERVDPQKVLQTVIFAFQNRFFLVLAVASHFWRGNPLSGWTPGKCSRRLFSPFRMAFGLWQAILGSEIRWANIDH